MVEKGIKGGTCNAIRQYKKANNKYMKDYDKNKESSHLSHWNGHNYMGGQCHKSFQHLILNGSKILLNLMDIS